jgi:hypothetical protein
VDKWEGGHIARVGGRGITPDLEFHLEKQDVLVPVLTSSLSLVFSFFEDLECAAGGGFMEAV